VPESAEEIPDPKPTVITKQRDVAGLPPPSEPRFMPRFSHAGFWRRLAAFIIDVVLLFCVLFPFGFLLAILNNFNEDPGLSVVLIDRGVIIATFWLYFSLMESSAYQATIGKMILRCYVTDLRGKRISFARATGRHFAKIISGIILYIGFLIIAFTDRKQGLHDMIAECLVIKRPPTD
jgi:uncharacterized RDD family membrane protein YckC